MAPVFAMLSFSSCAVIDNTLIRRAPSPPATDLHLEWDSGRAACAHVYSGSSCRCHERSCLVHEKPTPPLPKKTKQMYRTSQISPSLIRSDQWVWLIISNPAACVSVSECGRSRSVCPVSPCPSLQRKAIRTTGSRTRNRRRMRKRRKRSWTGRSAGLRWLHSDTPSGSRWAHLDQWHNHSLSPTLNMQWMSHLITMKHNHIIKTDFLKASDVLICRQQLFHTQADNFKKYIYIY